MDNMSNIMSDFVEGLITTSSVDTVSVISLGSASKSASTVELVKKLFLTALFSKVGAINESEALISENAAMARIFSDLNLAKRENLDFFLAVLTTLNPEIVTAATDALIIRLNRESSSNLVLHAASRLDSVATKLEQKGTVKKSELSLRTKTLTSPTAYKMKKTAKLLPAPVEPQSRTEEIIEDISESETESGELMNKGKEIIVDAEMISPAESASNTGASSESSSKSSVKEGTVITVKKTFAAKDESESESDAAF
jgi:hypothetical protein